MYVCHVVNHSLIYNINQQLANMRKFTQKHKKKIADRNTSVMQLFEKLTASDGLTKTEADEKVANLLKISESTVRRIRYQHSRQA